MMEQPPEISTLIAPLMSVRNGAAAISFYDSAFGAARKILTVTDSDTSFERALAAGATIDSPVSNQYGWRLGRVVDPYGHYWEIGRPLNS